MASTNEEMDNKTDTNEALSDTGSDISQVSQLSKSKFETPTTSKRKASPLYNSKNKQRSQSTRKTRSTPLTADSLVEAFSNPSLIESLTPAIQCMLTPSITKAIDIAIKTAIDTMKTYISDEIANQTSKLQETIDKKMEIIEKQKQLIDKKSGEIENLRERVDDLSTENITLKASLNDLEQYGRRNSLRFVNMSIDSKLEESEMTKQVVNFINSNILQSGDSKISEEDIDRCHPVGPKFHDESKQILVKFNSYHTKWSVLRSKGKLKKDGSKVFVCEDLTAINYKLVKAIADLKKNKLIYSFWTTNGNVLVRVHEDGPATRVKPFEDLSAKLDLKL